MLTLSLLKGPCSLSSDRQRSRRPFRSVLWCSAAQRRRALASTCWRALESSHRGPQILRYLHQEIVLGEAQWHKVTSRQVLPVLVLVFRLVVSLRNDTLTAQMRLHICALDACLGGSNQTLQRNFL